MLALADLHIGGGRHSSTMRPQLDRRVQHWRSPTGFVDAAAAPRGWLLMRPACRLATGGRGRDGSSFANSPVRALSFGHRPGYRGGRAWRGDTFRLGYPGLAVGSRDRGLSFDEAFRPRDRDRDCALFCSGVPALDSAVCCPSPASQPGFGSNKRRPRGWGSIQLRRKRFRLFLPRKLLPNQSESLWAFRAGIFSGNFAPRPDRSNEVCHREAGPHRSRGRSPASAVPSCAKASASAEFCDPKRTWPAHAEGYCSYRASASDQASRGSDTRPCNRRSRGSPRRRPRGCPHR